MLLKLFDLCLIFVSMKVLVLLVLFVLLFSQFKAQNMSGWYALFGNDKLHKGFNFHYEAQYRNHNSIGKLDQLLLRAGIGYSFSDDTQNILIGYGFIRNKDITCYEMEIPQSERHIFLFNEHRVFQQYIMKHRISHVLINHRYRFEQRFFSNKSSLRLRYFLSGYIPLNNSVIEKGTFYLGAYNELFMNLKTDYFDRNRSYLSFGYAVTNEFKIELGFLRQNISNDLYHHFQISFFNNMDFKFHH